MKKFVLAATALLLAGSFTAEAQRPTNPDGSPITRSGDGTRSGSGTRPGGQTGTRPTPAPAPAPVVVVRPTPAPVVRPVPPPVTRPVPPPTRVFVPVPLPPVVTWNQSEHRYSRRNHRVCQEKSHRLHAYERHAANDGFLNGRERRIISALRGDLARTCGGHRWRG